MKCTHNWVKDTKLHWLSHCDAGCGKHLADFYLGARRVRLKMTNEKILYKKVIKAQNDYEEGKMGGKAPTPAISFPQAVDRYISLYLIPNGRHVEQGFLDGLVKFFGEGPITEITSERVIEWRSAMLEKSPMATVKRRYVMVYGIFREAVKTKKIATNPCTGLFKNEWRNLHNPRERWLTNEETAKAFAAIQDDIFLRYAIIARNTGFRENNITNLDWMDVSFAQNTIKARHTKNDRAYTQRMNKSTRDALLYLWNKAGHPSTGRVFAARKSPEYWNNKFIDLFEKLGWYSKAMPRKDRATLHTFRHTFCSHMVMAGYNDRTIMEAMGWKSTAQLRTYAHLAPDYMQEAINSIDCGVAVPKTVEEVING